MTVWATITTTSTLKKKSQHLDRLLNICTELFKKRKENIF